MLQRLAPNVVCNKKLSHEIIWTSLFSGFCWGENGDKMHLTPLTRLLLCSSWGVHLSWTSTSSGFIRFGNILILFRSYCIKCYYTGTVVYHQKNGLSWLYSLSLCCLTFLLMLPSNIRIKSRKLIIKPHQRFEFKICHAFLFWRVLYQV